MTLSRERIEHMKGFVAHVRNKGWRDTTMKTDEVSALLDTAEEAERLKEALEDVSAGHVAGIASAIVAGNWKAAFEALQSHARTALNGEASK